MVAMHHGKSLPGSVLRKAGQQVASLTGTAVAERNSKLGEGDNPRPV